MYYVEKNENEVVKFNVHIYEEHLKEIRDRLIKDYSSIIYISNYLGFTNIKNNETDKIKNYSNEDLKIDFSYYIHPELVILIDMLLTNNVNVVEKIINYEQKKLVLRDFCDENFIKKVCNDITNELNIEITSNDLIHYINRENNVYVNNEDHTFLKEEILQCILFERISSININDFYKMMDFLDLNSKDVLNDQVINVRKKVR